MTYDKNRRYMNWRLISISIFLKGTEMVNQQLVDVKKLAEVLSVSIRQVFRLKAENKIPAPMKIGGSIRWKRSEIERWMEWDCPGRETFEAMKQKEGVS
ncbi:MAG TPA: DNA-binding protein [Phycisphaerales bacterium]|nr:DNA-binding protein [Phycisphaerales bacterium]